jgi:1-acyl-sn-glycerol-3-phosphate acyltransferase
VTFYRFAHMVVLSIFKVAFRVRVRGRENVPRRGAYVVAPSHRSILDIPFTAFITRRRIRFLAKKELFTTRIGRVLFRALGAIPVDREATDRAALRASIAALEAGEPVGVFPEGTRNNGPVLGDLHDGASYLAAKLGVPIVPVGIGGSEEILATGKLLPRIKKVAVVVGPPIPPPSHDGAVARRSDVRVLTETLRGELQKCFDAARAAVEPQKTVSAPSEARESG